VMVIQFI